MSDITVREKIRRNGKNRRYRRGRDGRNQTNGCRPSLETGRHKKWSFPALPEGT